MAEKPSLEEVLRYAKGNIMRFLGQYAADLPQEHKEEIEQTVYLRLIRAYEGLDADAGWKSFVFNHCRGGVLDYVKFGKGFEESKWSIQKEETNESKHVHKIRTRMQEAFGWQNDQESEGVEEVLNSLRLGDEWSPEESVSIRWRLVSQMAAQDINIHAFAKYLIGFSIEDISKNFNVSKARVSQLIQEFLDRFDSPKLSNDPWLMQTIYAFGLCKHFEIEDCDQSEVFGYNIGWSNESVDLMCCSVKLMDEKQMSLFDAV